LDRTFLRTALDRYKQFLYLKTKYPNDVLVPCYDIDLMWHSHLLNPVAYYNDLKESLGALFNHDDTVPQ